MSKIHIFLKPFTFSLFVFFPLYFFHCPGFILRLSLHKTQYTHVPGRIRTYNFTKRSAVNFGCVGSRTHICRRNGRTVFKKLESDFARFYSAGRIYIYIYIYIYVFL